MFIFNKKKIYHFSAKIGEKLYKICVFQFFLLLISFPILVAWGLPIAILAPLGNILFGPFLIIFLLVASLIFFTSLCGISWTFGDRILEHITALWEFCMAIPVQRLLMHTFVKPPLWVLLFLVIVTMAIMHYRFSSPLLISSQFTHRLRSRMVALLVFFTAAACGLKISQLYAQPIFRIPCGNKGYVTVLNTGKETVVIDEGFLGGCHSAASWAQYSFLTELARLTGRHSIDHFISLRPTQLTFETLVFLLGKAEIKTIYVPYWHGMMKKSAIRFFKLLQKSISASGGRLIRLGTQPFSVLSCDKNCLFSVESSNNTKQRSKSVRYDAVQYESVVVSSCFAGKTLMLNPYSCAKAAKKFA